MGGLILLDTTPWGTSALAVAQSVFGDNHSWPICTLLHYCAWVDIHSDPNAGMYMDNKSTTSLKFQGSKSLLPPLICRQASSSFVFKSWRWMRVRSSHNASLARRMANSISLWSPSIVFCIASSCCCTTFVRFLLAATAWTAVRSPASVGVLPQGTQVQPLL